MIVQHVKIAESAFDKICPECNSQIIQYGHEKVCEKCGLLIDTVQFAESYQINETQNSDLASGDQYVSIGKIIDNVCTLGSNIDYFSSYTFYDSKRKIIPSAQQKMFRKLKSNYSLQLKIKNHETDYRILKILNKIIQYMKLSNNVKNRAAYFYTIIKKHAPSIRNHVSLIAFCVFYASREYSFNAPVSIHEICRIFQLLGHRINPKLILRDSIEYQKFIKVKNSPHHSEDYLNRFIDCIINSPSVALQIQRKNKILSKYTYRILLMRKCYELMNTIKLKLHGSRNPYILAAALIYCADRIIAHDLNTKTILTQKIASEAMEIPEHSIRDHYVKVLKPMFLT